VAARRVEQVRAGCPELVEDCPELVEDCPELVEDCPELVEDCPELVEVQSREAERMVAALRRRLIR
jgi:hypothetical protein